MSRFSAFSNAFGLAVDRVVRGSVFHDTHPPLTLLPQLEVELVTPDGVYRTASSCQNADLFFALRGGGGGTFGVVFEVTMLALPQIAFPTYVSVPLHS